jgi:hypothetical protein
MFVQKYSKNKKTYKLENFEDRKTKIEYFSFCNILLLISYLRLVLFLFLLKNKNSKIQFLRGEPYFFKKKNSRSPGGEPAMVLS